MESTDAPVYSVAQYSAGAIEGLLSGHRDADHAAIAGKLHVEYFEEYFRHCKAKTVVVEHNYVDHDYLEDFAGYYVRCFSEYSRFATRLHFFSIAFSSEDFSRLLAGEPKALAPEALQTGYLGFVVVKPLPSTVVGRTCLKTYDDEPARRRFPSIRHYDVSLFGISLSVETLAFQEQDSVAAACATSALWSVLQGTAMLFHHAVPSPVEITKSGASHIPHSAPLPNARTLPNSGLTPTQMAYAVRHIGLEPHIVGVTDAYSLQSTTYAYLRGKVPVLLGVQLGESIGQDWEPSGLHAVAITGYSLGQATPIPWGQTGVLFTSSKVDKLYAHDDQVGPFARMPIEADGKMKTQWRSSRVSGGRLLAMPTFLLVPLYNKIRIVNDAIEKIVVKLDGLIETVRKHNNIGITSRIEWDIHLTTVNQVKKQWFDSLSDVDQRKRLLPMSLPKYLWRVVAIADGSTHLELLFDATDVSQGKLFVAGIDHIGALAATFQGLSTMKTDSLSVRAVLDAAKEF